VELSSGRGVTGFEDTASGVRVLLRSGGAVEADMVILSIGVTPNGAIAGAAGLELNKKGGIVTDSHMRTADPAVYAVGDVAEIEGFVFKDRKMVPLAGPANKQGRIAADNIAGIPRIQGHPGLLRGQGLRPHRGLHRRKRKVPALSAALSGARTTRP
jgi:NADPH-dependent 2,4-dienoyl-CoA reductase/sulfur reductase-like enzyme